LYGRTLRHPWPSSAYVAFALISKHNDDITRDTACFAVTNIKKVIQKQRFQLTTLIMLFRLSKYTLNVNLREMMSNKDEDKTE